MPTTVTTTLPDEPQQQLDNGVLDEITVTRTSATNNGIVRYQIRETGASTWDSSAAGFAEETAAFDADVVFTGLLDGESYEVRGRTETDYRTGAWTDPLSITTQFPGSANLTVTGTTTTSVTLGWDENADNEDGQLVVRERRLADGTWGREREVADAGVNTETNTDDTAQPDREYRYRIRSFTEHAEADSNTDTATTPALDGVRDKRIPPSDWHVEIDHPDGDTLTPTVLDGTQREPQIKGLPRVRVAVPFNDRWYALEGQPMRAWQDGVRVGVDRLETVEEERGDGGQRMILDGRGALELASNEQYVEVSEQETHLAARDTILDRTNLAVDVDDPASDVRDDILMQLLETAADLSEGATPWPPAEDVPLTTDALGIVTTPIGWFTEAEASWSGESTFSTGFSDGEAVALTSYADGGSIFIENEHRIPSDECEVAYVHGLTGENPGFEITIDVDGDTQQVDSVPVGALSPTGGETTLEAQTFVVNRGFDLPPGRHEVELSVTDDTNDGGFVVDFVHARDDRFDVTQSTSVSSGFVDGWEQYPASMEIFFEVVQSVEQVVSATLDVDITATDGQQALAVRVDGEAWQSESNTATTSHTWSDLGQTLQARVTLGRTDSDGSVSGTVGDEPHRLEALELTASLDDTPVLLDKSYRGRFWKTLNRMADSGDFAWVARPWRRSDDLADVDWDPDDPDLDEPEYVVEWTQAGQRTASPAVDVLSVDATETIETSFDRIEVFGSSLSVEGETFSQPSGANSVAVDEEWLVKSSERVYDTGDNPTEYERRIDYEVLYQEGGIRILDSGSMSTDTTYRIDYSHKPHGTATTPDVDAAAADTKEVEDVGVATDIEAEQVALSLLKQLQVPQKEATVEIATNGPEWSLVEAIDLEELPFDEPVVVNSADYSSGSVSLQVANRQSAGEIIDDIRGRYNALAEQT
ncbi:hypothetical protein [Halorubrum ezzemoulense]|uniref:Fibronectin type-III domain-containing protein n=1 Tax=Halorubrum ezzemoulense TaxID=337243 RepID=A0A256JIR4_HALEZ|nr:hypothetical protein [Halorubrum ezzemoulense]OYR68157.1 hypothetical protein DJ78_14585 [Halorubrum ezzemoulense]